MSITADQLASEFIKVCRETFTEAELLAIDKANAAYVEQGQRSVCATHDYADANMLMLEALTRLLGHEPPNMSEDAEGSKRWSEAWDLAKARGFSR